MSMSDPFPGLPRRVLFVDVTKPVAVTKIPVTKIEPVTKIASVTKFVTKMDGVTKTRGRPAKGDKPKIAAERMKLYRASKKLG